MKRKYWIIIIAVAIALGLALWFFMLPKAYIPETIKPRTLHSNKAYTSLLIGLWRKDGHVYYRFNGDGTGHTWDTKDDLVESEASRFEWEVYDDAIMITHTLVFRGIVPRYYELDRINAFDLRFHDSYSVYILEKVEEHVAMENDKEKDNQ